MSQFVVKIRDLQPGEVSVTKEVNYDGGEVALWSLLKRCMKLTPDVWLASVSLQIRLECVVPPAEAPATTD